MTQPYYITTPIYYVNDKPHVGHCYTTLVADCVARFMRAAGRDVFFLTGTDEHAEKVVASADANSCTPIEWADRNAAEFQAAFELMGYSNDDFIRTTQPRHTQKVTTYIKALQASGDVELGDYVGWYDPSQEEYLTESVAKEHDFKSPVTGKDLEKRTEKNYFFKLSKYADKLRAHIEAHPEFIMPDARRNEVLGRLNQGLNDVPISRAVKEGDADWGISMPGDDAHRIYVWIDALFNYLSTVDTDERTKYWADSEGQPPAITHLIAKDILWFHAVIWPCMLMALDTPEQPKPLPTTVYAHSFWVREGRKMSKSLGNFIDLPTLDAYKNWDALGDYGLDCLRWYLLTQGPLGATDADFSHAKFVEVVNADLANGIGNAASRVANMVAKYFDGVTPQDPAAHPAEAAVEGIGPVKAVAVQAARTAVESALSVSVEAALQAAMSIVNAVDADIADTRPFSIAKENPQDPRVASILYQCAEALRIAAVLLSPAMPSAMGELLTRFGQHAPSADGRFLDEAGNVIPLETLCVWGGLKPGTTIVKGDPLFPRVDAKAEAPVAVPSG